MSDQSRYPSSPSISTSRRPVPSVARPDWAWARSYTHRSPSQQGSPHSSVQGSNFQSDWDPRASTSGNSAQSRHLGGHLSRHSTGSRLQSSGKFPMAFSHPAESTRQWSFTGFEWDVRDIHRLRDYVETIEPGMEHGSDLTESEVGDFEVLKQSPMLGDHKFKLEIVRTNRASTSEGTGLSPATLSLYITSLMLDFAEDDYEMHASIMAAIKCQNDRVGERGARPDWIWEFWQNDWLFGRESEVWACTLPPLSALLQNPRIQETDSLVICIQIHSPVGPSIPQHPSMYHVPRDLLDGLEASLDNPNTGDVRFVCLEKCSSDRESDASISSNTFTSTSTPHFSSHPMARKRIIYAHSDILTRRSEYFATMLSSSFAENPVVASNGERKLYSVIVEEADFGTIYWLLKYCYANWLLFKQEDDPRDAVEGVGSGWSARWLNGQHGEWEWKPFHSGEASDDEHGSTDNKSISGSENVSSSVSRSASSKTSELFQQQPIPPSSISPPVNLAKSTSTSNNSPRAQSNPAMASRVSSGASTSKDGGALDTSASTSATGSRSKSVIPNSNHFPASQSYSVPPRSKRVSNAAPSLDPHPHPTPTPPPASALSIYQIAHRYGMPNLAALALEHIMSTIIPRSSFALLLATAAWDELHSLVEDYVVDRWDEVSLSTEFENCCKEVAAGEWGVDGGETLTSVFRRLRSPAL